MSSGVRSQVRTVFERLGTYKWRALVLLTLVFVLDYADRTLVGALGPTLKNVFGIGNFRFGVLAAAFLIVSSGAAIPMGMLADRVSRMTLLAVSFALWTVAMGFVGAAATFAMLFGFRMLLGAVSAAAGPVMPSLTGDLVPVDQRGRALGIVNSGVLIGLGLGFALPAVVTSFASWRWAFWLLGIAGAFLTFALWRIREPERTGASGPSEDDEQNPDNEHAGWRESREQRMVRERGVRPSRGAMVEGDPSEMSMWEAAKYTVRVRTDLLALIARSIGDFFLQGIATFVVVFVTGWYGVSQSFANVAVLVVGIGALVGVLVEGRVSDALLGRGIVNGRVWVGSLGYFFSVAAFYPAFISHSLKIALPLFAVGAFFLAGARPPLDAVRVDVLLPALRGRSEAIRQVIRALAEGGAPLLIGLLSTTLGGGGAKGVQLAFLVTLPALVLNGVIMLLALRTYQPDIAATMASSEKEQDECSSG